MKHLELLLRRRDSIPCRAVLVALLAMAGCMVANAQIYTGTDASGTLVLANFSSESSPVLLIAADAPEALARHEPASTAAHRSVTTPKALEPAIREAARRHSVPESLLTAVIAVESGFDSRAVSPKGAKGLMQLMPATARRFGVGDVFAVQDNLHGGAAYLSQLMALFANDRSLALAAYNAGEGAVLRAGRRIPAYPETQQYVAKVLAYAGRAAER
jgi:soluble lytic murein transglycosylase-like protein